MNAKSTSKKAVADKVPAIEFYNAATYTPDESVGFLMKRVISAVKQEIERELEPSGLTNAQWVPLFKLATGCATTGAELARECELDAGAMTRLLDRLETKGLCRRERSSEDRRVVNIEMTDEGRDAAKVLPEVLSRVQNAHLAGFTVEELQTLKSFLRRILDNAQAIQASREQHDK
jgi:DNA-binding MarR family transcriptional regulator